MAKDGAGLAGGTRAEYIASLEGAMPALKFVGSVFAGVGALLAVIGIVVAVVATEGRT